MSPKKAKFKDSAELRDRARWKYPDYAIQYYASARYAHFAKLTPVAGNLFHHAAELMLKHRLLKRFTWEELKDNYHHSLEKLWTEYKTDVADPALDRFNPVIAGLHRFEEIRYPEKLIRHGGSLHLAMKRQHISQPRIETVPVPSYDVALDEIDDLMLALFSSVNLKALSYFFHCDAEYLLKENPAWETAMK